MSIQDRSRRQAVAMEEPPEADDVDDGVQSQSVSASGPQSWDGSNHGGRSEGPPKDIREQRNQLEKQRRDRVARLVTELSQAVPIVKQCAKKPDKITILRLSASYLRQYQIFGKVFEATGGISLSLKAGEEAENLILELTKSVFFVVDAVGKIVYVSKTVEHILGYQEVELLGTEFKRMVLSHEQPAFLQCLRPNGEPALRAIESIASSEDSSDTGTSTSMSEDSPMEAPTSPSAAGPSSAGGAEQAPPTVTYQSRTFRAHVQHKPANKEEDQNPRFEEMTGTGKLVLIQGAAPEPTHGHRRRSQDAEKTVLFAFILRRMRDVPCLMLSTTMPQSNDEYVTNHRMDGSFMDIDHRIALVSGYFPSEVQEHNAFQYMHKEDARWARVALEQMLKNNQDTGFSVYRLKAKNGEYIFLRTQGYLKTNSEGVVDSFVCINRRITSSEAEIVRCDMIKNLSAIQNIDKEALLSSPKFVEVADDTPADIFAQEVRPPQRASVLKRSSKRGTVEEHVFGSNLKRQRYAGPSVSASASCGNTGRVPLPLSPDLVAAVPQGTVPVQRIVPMPALISPSVASSVPVPVVVSPPGAVVSPVGVSSMASAPGLFMGVPESLGLGAFDSVSDLPADLDVTLPDNLHDVLVDPGASSSSKATYQVHDMVYPNFPPNFPNAEWGRSELQVPSEPTRDLNLGDSNLSLYQAEEASSGILYPAQGVFMSLQPLDHQETSVATDVLHKMQHKMTTDLKVTDESVQALRQDIDQLPNPERNNLSNKLTQFQEDNTRHKKQLEDLSRQTKQTLC